MPLCLAIAFITATPSPRALYNDGVRAMQAGQYDQARDVFTQVTQLTPDWSLPWLELGVDELAIEGQTEAAIAAITKAIDLNGENPRAYFYLGMAHRRQDHFELAAAAFKRCTDLRPRWLEALMAYGETLDHLSQSHDAIGVYEQVRSLAPTQLGAVRRLAELYEQQGDRMKAESCWQSLVHANPGVAYYHYQLGEFYTRAGMPNKAKEAFADAAALDPRAPRKMRKLR